LAKKIDTEDLVKKIEKMTRDRLVKENVVSLDQYRELKVKKDPYSLLIIEDDETMRKALARIFESEGYSVKTAADGTQLSEVLDDTPIDLIIMDIGLPWVNGFELAKLLKQHKDLNKIPLIFVTGKTSELDVKRGFEVGADDYIKKPFDIEQIKKAVGSLLKV